jgi:hypothetical protein
MGKSFVTNIKVSAMKRIADDGGTSSFPNFMRENMKIWEREGLVTVDWRAFTATLTDKGRKCVNG